MQELYNREILRHAADIPHLGRLEHPNVTAYKRSRICGSEVTVDAVIQDGVVIDFAQEVKACALGQAACSIVGNHAIGLKEADLLLVKDQMEKMLKDAGPAPTGAFSDLKIFELAHEHKSRHTSIMLIFDCLAEAFSKVNQRANG